MKAVFVVSLGAAACGSVSNASDAGVDVAIVDAAVVDSPLVDAPRRCSPTAPFGTPSLIPGSLLNTGANEFNAQLTPNELGLYFVRDPGAVGGADVYVSTRTAIGEDFATPTPLPGVNGAQSGDYQPTVSADGLTLYLSTDQSGAIDGGYDVFVSTRATVASAFSAPVLVPSLSTTETERGTFLLPDGTTLYFSRIGNSGPSSETIFRATLGTAGFNTPVAVPGLTSGNGLPVVTPDELTMFFAQSGDIYVATRSVTSAPFGTLTKVTELSSSSVDEPSWVSADGCELYFASDRVGNFEMYVAKRGS